MPRLYVVLDVFTDTVLSGNPLAVVLDAQGLDDVGMQAIAREFNLSETVFLLPAEHESRKARLRIFTPYTELPFAGHPTVGTAVLLGLMDAVGGKGREAGFEIEEAVGPVRCRVTATGRRSGRAVFDLPKLPEAGRSAPTPGEAAAALGLDDSEIGFDGHAPSRFEAGNAFCFVPVRDLAALARASAQPGGWAPLAEAGDRGAFVYTRDVAGEALDFRTRMLRPAIAEDPATGSAVAAFAGAIMAFERPADGDHAFRIGQGFEMGRPSVIELGMTVAAGRLASATIGGGAAVAAEGALFTP